jgi:hypothetical protein
MWDPQHLTTLQASTACYGDSLTYFAFLENVEEHPRRQYCSATSRAEKARAPADIDDRGHLARMIYVRKLRVICRKAVNTLTVQPLTPIIGHRDEFAFAYVRQPTSLLCCVFTLRKRL